MADKSIPAMTRLSDAGKPICVMCDKPLRPFSGRSLWWKFSDAVQSFGWQGNSIFCTQRCAAEWGITKAAQGTDGP